MAKGLLEWLEPGERLVMGQVEVQRGDGDVAGLDGLEIGVFTGMPARRLAADPVVLASAGIEPLDDPFRIDALAELGGVGADAAVARRRQLQAGAERVAVERGDDLARIIGEHVLSGEQVQHASVFADAVAVGTYHLDYHWPDKPQRAGTGITTMVEPYQIPLRCLIPRGARNLLVPGRGASGDQMAMSSFRVMATVAQMGYAAGVAARQCVEDRTDLSDIDMVRLRATLESDGQSLDLSQYGPEAAELVGIPEPETFQPLPWDPKVARVWCICFRNREEREDPGAIHAINVSGGVGGADPNA